MQTKKTYKLTNKILLPIHVDALYAPLAHLSFFFYTVSKILKQDFLNAKYHDAVVVSENNKEIDLQYVEPDFLLGNITPNHRLICSPVDFITHPTTFIRISNFWKFTQYYSPRKIYYQPNLFNECVWGQWLLFNRIRVKKL